MVETPELLDRLEAIETQLQSSMARLSANEALAELVRTEHADSHKMIADLHRALMEPWPGHDLTLLQRMAHVTIGVERGQWAVRLFAWGCAATATFATAWAIFIQQGTK